MTNCLNVICDSEKSPKLRTYRQFKNEYKFENYFGIKNTGHVLALLRFRISSHNLRIETGRYTRPKTPSELRICLYCSSQTVEDEYLYNTERQELIRSIVNILPDFPSLPDNCKFVENMQNKNAHVLQALGKYVYTCLNKRSRIVLDTEKSAN
jgi:hypothetical protein